MEKRMDIKTRLAKLEQASGMKEYQTFVDRIERFPGGMVAYLDSLTDAELIQARATWERIKARINAWRRP
jgi:hypothetical protein